MTAVNLGALAVSHRVVVLAAARHAASGGLLITDWIAGATGWRRLNDRLHARSVASVVRMGWHAPEALARAAARVGFDGIELDAAAFAPACLLTGMLDKVQALIEIWGADHVGVRIAPFAWMRDRDDASAAEPYGRLLCALSEMEVAYVHVAGTLSHDRGDLAASPLGRHLRRVFQGMLIASGAYTPAAAIDAVESRWADAVGFDLLVGSGDSLVRSIAAVAGSAST